MRGSTLNLRGEGRIPWRLDARDGYLTFQSGYLRKSFDDAAERDLDDVEFKLVYRLIP